MKSRAGLICTLLKKRTDPAQILFMLALRNALLDCDSILDVGCGVRHRLQELGVPNTVGLEAYPPACEEARRQKTHDQLVLGDARNLATRFHPRQFDACIALDIIEHLTKDDGLQLMKDMEIIAGKRVVFFTPNGFVPQSHHANDDLQEHLSGWEPGEMRRCGYEITGQLGPKTMRGDYHSIRRPAIFWGAVSVLCQCTWIRRQPEAAAAILCVKELVPL